METWSLPRAWASPVASLISRARTARPGAPGAALGAGPGRGGSWGPQPMLRCPAGRSRSEPGLSRAGSGWDPHLRGLPGLQGRRAQPSETQARGGSCPAAPALPARAALCRRPRGCARDSAAKPAPPPGPSRTELSPCLSPPKCLAARLLWTGACGACGVCRRVLANAPFASAFAAGSPRPETSADPRGQGAVVHQARSFPGPANPRGGPAHTPTAEWAPAPVDVAPPPPAP